MRKLECPSCGANLELKEDNRDFAFCEFCGAKIMLDDYRSTQRIVDEAKIKHEETERMIKLQQLKLLEQKRLHNHRIRVLKTIISMVLGTLGLLMFFFKSWYGIVPLSVVMYIWFFSSLSKEPQDYIVDSKDYIEIPSAISGYENKNYEIIRTILENAGFYKSNIKCIPLYDLTTGWLLKPGTVDTITINGRDNIDPGEMFPKNSKIIITFHCFDEY